MAKCGLLFRKMSWAIQAKNEEMKALWWIKRDFRITDNKCLTTAFKEGSMVLPFFCGCLNKNHKDLH